MFGFYLIGYALGYLLLAIIATYVVVKVAQSKGATKRTKVIAALITLFIFWLIPFWDWLPTVIYHNYLCSTEAGVKINRSVEGVDGYYGAGSGALFAGYKYGYGKDYSGNYIRYRKNPDQSAIKPWIEEPAPEPPIYGVKYEQTKLEYMNEVKRQYVIYMLSSGEILATLTDFSVLTADPYKNLFEIRKAFWPFCRPCLWAGDTEVQLQKEIILKTLKPLQAK